MVKIVVSTDKMTQSDAYVCWLDIMGTKNSMSESFEKSANFILRFHAAVLSAKTTRDKVYPVMDGVYIVSSSWHYLTSALNRIMTYLAELFIGESYDHRFVVRGAIAKGTIQHGSKITNDVCPSIFAEDGYKDQLLFGMPMIQAYSSETFAPPFGIYIHESARTVGGLQGKYYFWKRVNKITNKESLQPDLKEALVSFFEWERQHSYYLGLPSTKFDEYRARVEEYFGMIQDWLAQ